MTNPETFLSKECRGCGITFYPTANQLAEPSKFKRKVYCTHRCSCIHYKRKNKPIIRISKHCLMCGALFHPNRNLKKIKYCSNACGTKAPRTATEKWKQTWFKKGQRCANTGRTHYKKGEDHPFWKGGMSPANKVIRRSLEYKNWRKAVFERDDYTCVWCGQRGGRLNADHIKRFADYPDLRFDLDNGRTLCEPCHRKTPTYGRTRVLV